MPGRCADGSSGRGIGTLCGIGLLPRPRPFAVARRCPVGWLSPAVLAQFSGPQRAADGFPFLPADERTPLRWLPGRQAADELPCWVPAFAVHVPYWPEPGEAMVAPAISTGLSRKVTRGSHSRRGLRSGRARRLGIDLAARPFAAADRRQRFRDVAGNLLPPVDAAAAYDLTSDVGLPVVLVVCRGKGPRGPLLSVGKRCHPSAESAMRKAALEAAQDRVYVRQLLDIDPAWRPLPDFSNVNDFSCHARLYRACPELADRALEFLAEPAGGIDKAAAPSRGGTAAGRLPARKRST